MSIKINKQLCKWLVSKISKISTDKFFIKLKILRKKKLFQIFIDIIMYIKVMEVTILFFFVYLLIVHMFIVFIVST